MANYNLVPFGQQLIELYCSSAVWSKMEEFDSAVKQQ